jgi:hypothetical protein
LTPSEIEPLTVQPVIRRSIDLAISGVGPVLQIETGSLPFTSLPIYYSLFIPQFNAIQDEPLEASLNRQYFILGSDFGWSSNLMLSWFIFDRKLLEDYTASRPEDTLFTGKAPRFSNLTSFNKP